MTLRSKGSGLRGASSRRPERVERPRREARVIGSGREAQPEAAPDADASPPAERPDPPVPSPDDAPRPRRGASLSLKGRALKLLSQRDHSRLELVRKLSPHAESPEQLERALDELEQGKLLSESRFAESLVRRRAERYGLRRIEQELGTHRLDPEVSGPALAAAREGERERALAAWRRRFGGPAASAAERARQHRFLAQRGFTGGTIAWVLRHGADDETPAAADDDASA